MTLAVRQTVIGEALEGGGRLRLEVSPQELVQNGIQIAPGPPVVLDVEVEETGSVTRIVRPAAIEVPGLQELELEGLLREVLPPLPARSSKIGDGWDAGLSAKSEQTSIDLEGRGRLVGFSIENRRRLARVTIARAGHVETRQRIGRAPAALSGETEAQTSAEVDLDAGMLVRSETRTESRFEFIPPGGIAPTTISLVVTTLVTYQS